MAFIYHKVPANMSGNILYPLNELKRINPAIFEAEIKKYEGREYLLQRMIPLLHCLWNDVLHLSMVHPSQIKDALFKVGHPYRANFFEVPLEAIDKRRAVIYLYRQEEISPEEIKPFNPLLVEQLSELSAMTKEYFAAAVSSGRKVLPFHGVPHVLYRGSLDISDFKIIKS